MATKKKKENNRFRAASFSLATPREEDKGYDYDNFGVMFGDRDYPGSGSVLLELDHPERVDANGYPVKGKAVAILFRFPPDEEAESEEAEEIPVDLTGSFINATFWHEMEARPKKKAS